MADKTSKVVPLSSYAGRKDDGNSHLFVRLPAPFVEAKDKGKQALQPLLQALFDNIDDALFELADRAEHNAEQNMYFESMREVRIKRRGMELSFGKAVDGAFIRLLPGNVAAFESSTAETSDQVSADSLSLVAHDELEELVAIENMVIKAEHACASGLKPLTTRLDTLIEHQVVTVKNNPFGPTIICQSFIDVCKTLDLDIKAKLVLFKLFERYVMGSLLAVYNCCNEALVEGGILPNLSLGQRAEQRSSASAHSPSNASPDSSRSSEQQSSRPADIFTDLQQLLQSQPRSNAGATHGLVAPGQGPQIPRDTLMQLLQAVQNSLMQQMEGQQQAALAGVRPQQLDIQQTLSTLLSSKMPEKPMSIGQVDDDAINLVAMLFQFILDDRNLAAPMKALISRLQIPIIKVSMMDKSFFNKSGHPARKLLNEIASASLGWVPTSTIDRDPLYNKVSSVVNKIQHGYDGDADLFKDVLADFIAFLDIDKRRIGLVEQRTINAEDGKAKSELARTQVQTALNQRVAGLSLPKVVITLLEDAWSNVLFLIVLKEGEDEKSWHDALQVVDDLLWSVAPMQDTASRQQLLTLMPQLLASLRTGLSKIGLNPFDMNQLFTDLELIHLAQLKQLNTVKLDVSEQAKKVQQEKNQQTIARETQAIEKTLDQVLEERDGSAISLEQLDAELEEQLAGFDALGDLVAQGAEDTIADAALPPVTEPSTSVTDQQLVRHVVDKLVINGASHEDLDAEVILDSDDPCLTKVDALTMGSWVELHQDNDKKFRCRLAAVIRATDKYIFVNRSGMKVSEYSRKGLAMAIKNGQVSTLDESLLFDRALESVIGNLRTMKAGS
jgi:hypothetical protein